MSSAPGFSAFGLIAGIWVVEANWTILRPCGPRYRGAIRV